MTLRPYLSPSGPKVSAPSVAPTRADEHTGPSAAWVSFMFAAMIGAATPMFCVSMPSRKAASEHKTNTKI